MSSPVLVEMGAGIGLIVGLDVGWDVGWLFCDVGVGKGELGLPF